MQVYMDMCLRLCRFVRIITMSVFRESSKRDSTAQLVGGHG